MENRPEALGLPAADIASMDVVGHDLSYLSGPPFTVPGQSTKPKRFFPGLAENARVLQISKVDLLKSDAQSPFYSIVSATQDHSNLPISLQPTKIQHRYPHHPFFDCIPIPGYRDRAILASATTPPLINRFDLCYEMFAGGLTYEGDPAMEQSWRFSDAFSRKWGALINFDLLDLQRRADQRGST